VADKPLALAGERVDRAGRDGILGRAIDERDDPLLVRDCQVCPKEVVAADLLDRACQLHRRAIPELVGRVDPRRVQGGLLHRPGEGMGDRMADEHDPLAHDRILSSSSKKRGSEMATLDAP